MPVVKQHPVGSFSWLELATSEPSAAAGFYAGLMGWAFRESGQNGPGETRLAVLPGGGVVCGMGSTLPIDGVPSWTLFVNVRDAASAAAQAVALGGTVAVDARDHLGARIAVVRDPHGASVGLWQTGTCGGLEVNNEPGAMMWAEYCSRTPDASLEFYRGLFGWEGDADRHNKKYTLLRNPRIETDVVEARYVGGMVEMDETWDADVPHHWLPYLEVDSLDASLARFKELGGAQVTPEMKIPDGRFVVANDPQGAVFILCMMRT